VREDVGCNQMLNMASLSCDKQLNRPICNITIILKVKYVISAPIVTKLNYKKKRLSPLVFHYSAKQPKTHANLLFQKPWWKYFSHLFLPNRDF